MTEKVPRAKKMFLFWKLFRHKVYFTNLIILTSKILKIPLPLASCLSLLHFLPSLLTSFISDFLPSLLLFISLCVFSDLSTSITWTYFFLLFPFFYVFLPSSINLSGWLKSLQAWFRFLTCWIMVIVFSATISSNTNDSSIGTVPLEDTTILQL